MICAEFSFTNNNNNTYLQKYEFLHELRIIRQAYNFWLDFYFDFLKISFKILNYPLIILIAGTSRHHVAGKTLVTPLHLSLRHHLCNHRKRCRHNYSCDHRRS